MQAILHLKIYSRIDFLKFQNSKTLCGSNKTLSHQKNNKQTNKYSSQNRHCSGRNKTRSLIRRKFCLGRLKRVSLGKSSRKGDKGREGSLMETGLVVTETAWE